MCTINAANRSLKSAFSFNNDKKGGTEQIKGITLRTKLNPGIMGNRLSSDQRKDQLVTGINFARNNEILLSVDITYAWTQHKS